MKNRGQISIFVIILLFIAGLFLFSYNKPNPILGQKTVCYLKPDSSRSIQFDNITYDLIRERSALSVEQFGWHIKELNKIQYGGVERTVRRAKIWAESEPAHPELPQNEIAGFPPAAKDLLFLDVNDLTQTEPGYIFVDIFLKRGVAIPEFIKQFCDVQHQPIDPIKIFPGPNGTRFPPARIAKSELNLTSGSTDGETFTLFAYERIDSDVGRVHNGNGLRAGTVTIEGKTYQINLVSYAGYLALFDDASGYIYLYSKILPPPPDAPPIGAKQTLQLNTLDVSTLYPWGWWSPECKPAIYLYPTTTTPVHVEVNPVGFLTYTKPQYPVGGWNVLASPNGTLLTGGKTYPYLYYESKIKDAAIIKPTQGYVIAYDKLQSFYIDILPKLGLSAIETADFIEYWDKKLPQSPYYFVGIMNEESIEKIEPLQIFPKPETMIRVRLYFEPLVQWKDVSAPSFTSYARNGFTAVEWGGMVKNDKNHPFTCSQ